MKKIVREPLVHFLLLGAVIFAVNAWRSAGRPTENALAQIEVSAAVVERLGAGYERQFGRGPDEDEMRGLVTAHIREEVLYREALAMGLDRDDSIVRRRMAQKMEFLTDDITGAPEADDVALQAFFAENAARYAKPARVSFQHVYFSKEKRGAGADASAREALAALAEGASDETLGDTFLHGFEFAEQEQQDVGALFGGEFADRLATAADGKWSEPMASSYGLHLVRIEKRAEARPANFDEVREVVLRDFRDERRRTVNRQIFERLLERYRVAVDEDALKKATLTKGRTAQR